MSAELSPLLRRTPERPQERGDRRRDDLLAALESALGRAPLGEISVAEVARAAGATRPAFYFYFANKQAAVFALLQDLFVQQVERVTAILEQGGDRPGNLAAALGLVVEEWREHGSLMRAALEARSTDPDAAAAWDAWLERYVGFLADFIRTERAEGRAVTGPDPDLLARALILMNERMLERHLHMQEDEAAAAQLHRIVVHVWSRSIYRAPLEED